MECTDHLKGFAQYIYKILFSSKLETLDVSDLPEEEIELAESLNYLKQSIDELSDFLKNMIQGHKVEEISKENPFFDLLFSLNESFEKRMIEKQNSIALEKQLEQQVQYYQLMTEDSRRLSSFRHDTRNHYLCLDSLLMRGDIKGARNYIKKINTIISPEVNLIKTQNIVFDALITDKLRKARDKGIEVDPDIVVSRTVDIESFDWCTLFGNSMDNAIEACERVIGKKKIWFQVRLQGRLLQTTIKNTALPPQKEDGVYKTFKDDPERHGLGMRNMAEAVLRYDGVMETEFKNGIFTLIMLLCGV